MQNFGLINFLFQKIIFLFLNLANKFIDLFFFLINSFGYFTIK